MARLLSGSGTIGGGATQAELDAFVGSTNITTLGVIGTGEWEGVTVAVNQGGTGRDSLYANNVLLGNVTSAVQQIAPSTSGNVLTSNGSTWASTAVAVASGGLINVQIFTAASSTYTKTAGTNSIVVYVTGGGGGGNTGGSTHCGGGGGGGGTAIERITGGVSGITVTVGAGGGGRTGVNSSGYSGGTSAFTGYCTATGGQIANDAPGDGWSGSGVGGIGSDGLINLQGNGGSGGDGASAALGHSGGGSYWGGGSFAKFGAPNAGGPYGGGGNGVKNVYSGAGYAGVVVIFEYT